MNGDGGDGCGEDADLYIGNKDDGSNWSLGTQVVIGGW